jgi:hypothetical protein
MRTAQNPSDGPLSRMPPAWLVTAGVLTLGAANLALIVAVAVGSLG